MLYGPQPDGRRRRGISLGAGRRAGRPGLIVLASAVVVVVLLAAGLFYFRRTEGTFADVI